MNVRVGLYYLLGGVVLCATGYALRPFGILLCWPGLSLLIVAAGYFGAGARVFGKSSGGHPLWAKLLFLFVFAGHEISRRLYARQCDSWDEVIPGLLIGRQMNAAEAESLVGEGVRTVLDLTAEFGEPSALTRLNYLNIPLLDLTAPNPDQLAVATRFISGHIRSGPVYVHCKIGYSRTAAVVGSYLIRTGHAKDAEEAIRILRAARPSIIIRPEARATIKAT